MTDKLTPEQRKIYDTERGNWYGNHKVNCDRLFEIIDALAPKPEPLLPCPFCGAPGHEALINGMIGCSGEACANRGLYNREQWQRRAGGK